MDTKEKIAVMQAFEDGSEIESLVIRGTIILRDDEVERLWQRDLEPTWNWEACMYRVKNPKETIEL